MTNDRDLRLALESFRFDADDVSFTFAARLARENGWSSGYTRAAIAEYLRFVHLCAISDQPLTPSDAVDQVWHLHLTYSRSYWDELCGRILGRPLHHGPTRGGADEQRKYAEWYARTLDLYQRVYGQRPPPDVWPDVEARFVNADAFRRVDTSTHWVIRKRHVRAAAIGAALCAVAVPAYAQDAPLSALTVGVLIAAGLALVVFVGRRIGHGASDGAVRGKKRDGADGGASCGAAVSKHGDDGGGDGGGSGCGGSGCGGCGGG